MARKQLIKGANASRVEQRIGRVPADVVDEREEAGIFSALKAMEESRDEGRRTPRTVAAKPVARQETMLRAAPPEERSSEGGAGKHAPSGGARSARVGPSDFTAAEREAIVRCCTAYRNLLPTYLLSVQKEVRTIDSVIDKCEAAEKRVKREAKD